MLKNESTSGRRGRVLQNDFPSLGLLDGDRLEPSRSLRDIREFDRAPVGTRVLFWRAQNESLAKHRCPMFTPESHITISTLSLRNSPRAKRRSIQGQREGSVLGVSACRCVGHARSYANQSHRRRHPFAAQRSLTLVRRQERIPPKRFTSSTTSRRRCWEATPAQASQARLPRRVLCWNAQETWFVATTPAWVRKEPREWPLAMN